jgi:hypothetical protein
VTSRNSKLKISESGFCENCVCRSSSENSDVRLSFISPKHIHGKFRRESGNYLNLVEGRAKRSWQTQLVKCGTSERRAMLPTASEIESSTPRELSRALSHSIRTRGLPDIPALHVSSPPHPLRVDCQNCPRFTKGMVTVLKHGLCRRKSTQSTDMVG